jgi:hypothetical protein
VGGHVPQTSRPSWPPKSWWAQQRLSIATGTDGKWKRLEATMAPPPMANDSTPALVVGIAAQKSMSRKGRERRKTRGKSSRAGAREPITVPERPYSMASCMS